MKQSESWIRRLLVALLVVGCATSWSVAQEDSEEDDFDVSRYLVEAGIWASKPNGLGYRPVSQTSPVDGFTQVRDFDPGTEGDVRYLGELALPDDLGSLRIVWFATRTEEALVDSTPGTFQFGALLANPIFAGFQDNGLADGFESQSATVLRDLRLEFARTAIDTDRVQAKWFAGVRRITHTRTLEANYSALAGDLPPFAGDLLQPLDDTVFLESDYTGRGLNLGFEANFPFAKRFQVETALGVAAMIGQTDTRFNSNSTYYVFNRPSLCPGDTQGIIDPMAPTEFVLLRAPFAEFEQVFIDDPAGCPTTPSDPPSSQATTLRAVDLINQQDFPVNIEQTNVSQTSMVIEGSLGVRANVTAGLEAFIGYRLARYTEVGIDLLFDGASSTGSVEVNPENGELINGFNLQRVREESRSVTYDGVYVGLGYRF